MNGPDNAAGVVCVDWEGLRSTAVRIRAAQILEAIAPSVKLQRGAWRALLEGAHRKIPERLLVIADLSTCAAVFQEYEPSAWRRAIRAAHPYILALVRTRADEVCAHLVGHIVSASGSRVAVSRLGRPGRRPFEQALGRAVRGTDPSCIVDVRYSSQAGALWLEFGDGLRAVIDWADLELDDVPPRLVPDTVTLGADLDTIRVWRTSGEAFDIDSAALRGLVDKTYAARLQTAEAASAAELGMMLRAKRKAAGLTQMQLARASNLEQSLISKLENGRHRPLYDTLAKYAEGLGMGVVQLLRS